MSHVTLVCGYRGTGKDYLHYLLNNKQQQIHWFIYSDKNVSFVTDYKRLAFADALKNECQILYEINSAMPDKEKDMCQLIQNELTTPRSIYIKHGLIRRNEDENYWVKIVSSQINAGEYIITDWRFPNELYFLQQNYNVSTIRVFRSCVREPDMNIESEHSLDNNKTDVLLVTNEEEFMLAVKRFPQYKNYTCVGFV